MSVGLYVLKVLPGSWDHRTRALSFPVGCGTRPATGALRLTSLLSPRYISLRFFAHFVSPFCQEVAFSSLLTLFSFVIFSLACGIAVAKM